MKFCKLSCFLGIMLSAYQSYSIASTVLTEDQKIISSTASASDYFGKSMAIADAYAIVGAYGSSSSSGTAFLYQRSDADGWQQIGQVIGSSSEQLGTSVATDGKYFLMGAPYGNSYKGIIYVYQLDESNTAILSATLTASDGYSGDFFGESVAIQGDYAVVGSYKDDACGSVYVFKRQSDGGWLQQTKLIASDKATDDYFGYTVSLTLDEEEEIVRVAVGAFGDDDKGSNSGSAYIFEEKDGNWSQIAKLKASDGAASDYFASKLSLMKSTLLVGAYLDDNKGSNSGSAYIFTKNSDNTWSQATKLTASDGIANDYFGSSVVLDAQDVALIGAHGNDDKGTSAGSAYFFKKDSTGNWIETYTLLASDGGGNDYLGKSVALDDGSIFVGASGDNSSAGSAYAYSIDTTMRYVATTGNDIGACLSSTQPCRTIMYAISQSVQATDHTYADQINIAAGTYYENISVDRAINLVGQSSSSTILDGNNQRVVIISDSYDKTIDISLKNLTVQNGSDEPYDDDGKPETVEVMPNAAGIDAYYANLWLDSSSVTNNHASNLGSGGIRVTGNLTVNNSIISNNTTDGLEAGGIDASFEDAEITNSSVLNNEGYEGGISSRGNLTIANSTVANNESGIHFNSETGTLSIENSSIYGNGGNSSYYAGGIYIGKGAGATITNSAIYSNVGYDAGGIYTSSENFPLWILNSTISDNIGVGIFSYKGNVVLHGTTVTNNSASLSYNGGGGVQLYYASLTAENSIIAGNNYDGLMTASTADCYSYGTSNSGGTSTSLGYNVTGVATGCDFINQSTDYLIDPTQVFTTILEADIDINDPNMSDDYVPTKTHALIYTSNNAALNGGNCNTEYDYTIDQRNASRPALDGCDIGAFELQEAESDI